MSQAVQPRTLFVISDLHVGGDAGDAENPRGFRMCTRPEALCAFLKDIPTRVVPGSICELVINGDFVDFLSEVAPGGGFSPFLRAEDALAAFHRIVAREQPFFDALRAFAADHWLTILLGNHDVELAHPEVTEALIKAIGGPSNRLRVQLDGAPYLVGDALIEHGNLYDGFNAILPVEVEELRRSGRFEPPPGSKLVAEIMNPIKGEYPFIDLLKPEQETAIPILLALRPRTLGAVARIAKLSYDAAQREKWVRFRLSGAASAQQDGDLVLALAEPEVSPEEALRQVLARALDSEDKAREFLDLLSSPPPLPAAAGDASFFSLPGGPSPINGGPFAPPPGPANKLAERAKERLGFFDGLRAELLWLALQGTKQDLSFTIGQEHDQRYHAAAGGQARGVRWVVMGHTHLAKEHTDIIPGRTYINTGTWADLLPFPEFVTSSTEEEGKRHLHEFIEDLKHSRLDRWLSFRPHFARLEFDGEKVVRAGLELFSAHAQEPEWRARGVSGGAGA